MILWYFFFPIFLSLYLRLTILNNDRSFLILFLVLKEHFIQRDSAATVIAFDNFYLLIKEKRFARSFKLIFPSSFTAIFTRSGNCRILIRMIIRDRAKHPLLPILTIYFLRLNNGGVFFIALFIYLIFFSF